MYLDQRKKYSLDFKTEYIETKQMGYENRLDLDRILLDFETLDKFKKFVYDAEFDQYLTVEEAAERKLKVTA